MQWLRKCKALMRNKTIRGVDLSWAAFPSGESVPHFRLTVKWTDGNKLNIWLPRESSDQVVFFNGNESSQQFIEGSRLLNIYLTVDSASATIALKLLDPHGEPYGWKVGFVHNVENHTYEWKADATSHSLIRNYVKGNFDITGHDVAQTARVVRNVLREKCLTSFAVVQWMDSAEVMHRGGMVFSLFYRTWLDRLLRRETEIARLVPLTTFNLKKSVEDNTVKLRVAQFSPGVNREKVGGLCGITVKNEWPVNGLKSTAIMFHHDGSKQTVYHLTHIEEPPCADFTWGLIPIAPEAREFFKTLRLDFPIPPLSELNTDVQTTN